MRLFGRSGSSRRPPPSDTEIRMRCIEASTRLASSSHGVDDQASKQTATDALIIAQAYYAFVKGRHLNSTILPHIAKPQVTANTDGNIGATESASTSLPSLDEPNQDSFV